MRIDADSPEHYIAQLDEPRRSDVAALHDLIVRTAPSLTPEVRGGMLGYGSYRYRYASGREGEAPVVGLASQARYISLYACPSSPAGYDAEQYRERLPKADLGKGCIRFKRVADVDLDVLADVVRDSQRAAAAMAG